MGEPMKHESVLLFVAFSHDGSRLATSAMDRNARLWDAYTGAQLGGPMKHDNLDRAVAFSPDDNRIATISDYSARLWDAHTGAPMSEPIKHDGKVTAVAFSPDGSQIATASYDKTVRLWDAHTIMPKNMISFVNRFAEKPDPVIPRDIEFEGELKIYLARKRFLYRSLTAIQSVAKKHWFAAKFHLPWLIEQEPDNPRWKKLLDEVNPAQ